MNKELIQPKKYLNRLIPGIAAKNWMIQQRETENKNGWNDAV